MLDKAKQIIIENLSRLMADRGLNQKQLAEKAKMDPVQLNRIMTGKKGAGPKSRRALALALGCGEEEIISKLDILEKSEELTLDDAIALLSAFQRAEHDTQMIVLQTLGIGALGNSHSETSEN